MTDGHIEAKTATTRPSRLAEAGALLRAAFGILESSGSHLQGRFDLTPHVPEKTHSERDPGAAEARLRRLTSARLPGHMLRNLFDFTRSQLRGDESFTPGAALTIASLERGTADYEEVAAGVLKTHGVRDVAPEQIPLPVGAIVSQADEYARDVITRPDHAGKLPDGITQEGLPQDRAAVLGALAIEFEIYADMVLPYEEL